MSTAQLYTDTDLTCREEKMTVVDYCQRNMLDLSAVELSSAMPGLCGGEGGRGAWLTLIQNSDKRTSEMIVIFQDSTDRQTWIDLVKPKEVELHLMSWSFQLSHSSGEWGENIRQLGLSAC